MIFSVEGETICPECDFPHKFEVTEIAGKIEVTCPACNNVEVINYNLVVEVF